MLGIVLETAFGTARRIECGTVLGTAREAACGTALGAALCSYVAVA